jgi:hypothetical protein
MIKILFLTLCCSFIRLSGHTEIVPLKKDTLTRSSFSEVQLAKWNELEAQWKMKHFNPFLNKHKIKMNCATCTHISMEIVFSVFEDGHAHCKIISSRKCGKEFTPKQLKEIEKLLFQFEFPESFNNTVFRVNIGEVLKC